MVVRRSPVGRRRIQVVTETGTAILMRLAADDWQVEGVYD